MIWGLCLLYCTYREKCFFKFAYNDWEISPGEPLVKEKQKRSGNNKKGWFYICWNSREETQKNEFSLKVRHFLDVMSCGSVMLHTDGSVLFPPSSYCWRIVWQERWTTTMHIKLVGWRKTENTKLWEFCHETETIQAKFKKQVLILNHDLPEYLFWDVPQIWH